MYSCANMKRAKNPYFSNHKSKTVESWNNTVNTGNILNILLDFKINLIVKKTCHFKETIG